jgi:diacylglycerol cholinephosphotransferase
LSPALPMGFLLFSGCTLYLHSPTDLFMHHPCLFILTFGMSSSKIAINLVVAHVSKSAMPLVDSALLGPFLFLMNLYFWSVINDFYLMLGTLVFGVFDLIYSSTSTCIQICSHMKINCFTICPNQTAK